MSSIAWKVVLAHELGHYFGLPHSEYPASIMNKSRKKDRPPEKTWAFHVDEVSAIEKRRVRLVRTGDVEELKRKKS